MFEINWSDEAKNVYYETLEYWSFRNKSDLYSEKIIEEVENMELLIAKNPSIGIKINFKGSRKVKVLKYFSLIYLINANNVEILSFWDNRRDPENLDIK
ncbi:type II toxin-antitoxin system RelE/ParE family toxin [Frigoriflavimonas asaccharolytica]|uniref:Plasmid stabilization system protein ParE n=1 Tax=Frigoriflavimonas asaccharolytica TaxID=2735899 RepID=A0A8J8G8L0_9FLAO|nr:type II toxin-antitoxin system RelE/ParE family toxin [Frigoriflavimonas asaccharolytica]NRS93326.1 hypothetical protein [Frigoriflavimonas asaccharolytica]